MKTVVAFLLVVVIVAAAQAEEFEWHGTQALALIDGEVPIVENKLSFRSSVSYFWIPSDGTQLFFSYSGPKWIVQKWSEKDSLWLAPQAGIAGNWAEDGSDAILLSLWSGISLLEGQVSLFVEEETYLNLGQKDYYAYYSLDYSPIGCINIGAHLQQVNKEVSFGPHIGVTHGSWHSEIRYFAGFQEDNRGHTVRLVIGLNS